MPASPRYPYVIFDLDGTLLNTLDDLANSCNYVCELHGWPPFERDAYRYKIGNGMLKLIERILPAEYVGDEAMFSQALAEFRAHYAAHKEDNTAPYEGVPEMLERLRAAGVKTAVLTNKDHSAAVPLMERYFGPDAFAHVQGREERFAPKPAAPVTLHVLEVLGAEPARTLCVGDSNVDVRCGHNAGLAVAGVTWGFRSREELEAEGAEYIVDTPEELLQLIL